MKERAQICKLLILIGAVVAILGCFLPYYTISAFGFSQSISYVGGNGGGADGIIVIALAIVAVLAVFVNSQKLKKIAIVPAVVALLITIYDMIQVRDATEGYGSFGIGAYLVLLGMIACVVGYVLSMVWKINSQDTNNDQDQIPPMM